ncbi:MAG TPA: aminotransferase class I/II-fold pyridoxal phosphate-dependent enzyme [Terriglobales bacterium]
MKIKPFTLERWQSIWENQVGINLSESGVHPLTVEELVTDAAELQRILRQPLGYPQTNGSEALRARVTELYPGATAQNVLMTSGCSEANFVAIWGLVEPGDDVVFMQPNYMQISGVAESIGATVTPLWLREASGWQVDASEVRQAITSRTKLVAVCNPNNPTGAVMSKDAMDAVCERAAEVGAWVLSDEVYRGAEFEGNLTPTMWGKYERVLCTAGLSKAYSLPGLRTGWIVGPADVVDRLWGVHDYTSIAISMLTDKLATIALEAGKRQWILERTRHILRENYAIVKPWINAQDDLFRHVPPQAGGIAWLGYNRPWSADVLVEELRKRKDMLLVPGTQFGMDQFLRIGFAGGKEQLKRGLALLAELLAEFEIESAAARGAR